MTRRIGVIGARVHGRPDQVRHVVQRYAGQDVVIVSGGAEGVDTWAEDAAREVGLPVRIYRPAEMRRDALLARDRTIAGDVDELHVFPWWGSRGSYYTARIARDRGVDVVEHPKEPLCEVWTTRLGSADPDELNITREIADARAEKFRGNDIARLLGDHDPMRRLCEMAADMEQNQGCSLLEIQRERVLASPIALGAPWAPSLKLKNLGLRERDAARRMHEVTGRAKEADEAAQRAWDRYLNGCPKQGTIGFLAEMRTSAKDAAIAWGWLLARRPVSPLAHPPPAPSRVVLACLCQGDPAHCHRTVVASLLGKMGAIVRGELPRPPKTPAGDAPLFDHRRPDRS